MAIIEDVDSDASEVEQMLEEPLPKPPASANRAGATAIAVTCDNPGLERLLKGKAREQESDLIELVQEYTLETLWNDLLVHAQRLLSGIFADELDITRLERLASLVLLVRKSDGEDLSVLSKSAQLQSQLLASIVSILVIPCHFMLPDYEITSETQAYWRAGSLAILQFLQTVLSIPSLASIVSDSTERRMSLITTLSRFLLPEKEDDDDELEISSWSTPLSASIARATLHLHLVPSSHSSPPSSTSSHSPTEISNVSIARHILLSHIKPLFSQSAHKDLHPETARALPRPRGGDQFSANTWVEEVWKGKSVASEEAGAVGCWKVFEYVVGLLEAKDMQDIWPVLVPPLMTLLDDHEVRYRSQGVRSLGIFLDKVPAALLVRTGLSDLIQKALTTTYSFTSDSSNIPTIRASFHCDLQLINLLYPSSSSSNPSQSSQSLMTSTTPLHRSKVPQLTPHMGRFNHLSSVYQNLILSIFAYQSNSIPYMTLSFLLLPTLIREMGQGSIRFLGDTVPVLNSALGDSYAARGFVLTFSKETIIMHIAALRSLISVIEICKGTGRMNRWRASILSSLATVWCNLKETPKGKRADTGELEGEMRRVVGALEEDGGLEGKKDVQGILALDPELFAGLCGENVGA